MFNNVKKPLEKIYNILLEEIKQIENLAESLKDKGPMDKGYVERKSLQEELFYLHEIRRDIEKM
jgi:hypothetical protein